jgi:hypothetical protein
MRKLVTDTCNILYRITGLFWLSYVFSLVFISFLIYSIIAGFIEILAEGYPFLLSILNYVLLPKGLVVYAGVLVITVMMNSNINRIMVRQKRAPDYVRLLLLTVTFVILLVYRRVVQLFF